MGCLLASGRLLAQGGPALYLDGGESVSHDRLEEILVEAESALLALGVGRRTRVMTALPDGPLTACVLLALARTAVCAPVNPDLRGAELAVLIPELAVEVLVAHGLCAAEARQAATALGLPMIEVDWDAAGGLRWSGAALKGAPARPVAAEPDDTALVLLTSGSSARPKRVPLTHRQLTLAAKRMAESVALTAADCCLNLMPMFHVGAVVDLLLAPLSVGGSVLRPEVMSVAAFFAALDTGRPTWFQGVPTLLHELAVQAVRHPNEARAALRFIRAVSSPLPQEWLAEIERALAAPIIEIYGMTETAGIITSNPLPPAVRKRGSVGKATSLEIVVRGSEGLAAEVMERGEISVRGPGVMQGYEGLTGEAGGALGMTVDGWLCTGDEGYFDADGFLFITGRIGDQINRGGEKISPREIDEVLASHPSVQDVAVFAVPHPQLGQEVAAAIVVPLGLDGSLTAATLAEHVGQHLAYFKVPKQFYVVPALPRGPGGKLRRRLLPDMVRELTPLGNAAPTDLAAPQTEMEKRVAAWWEAELRVTGIGRQGHFFDLGGDSLAAASVTVGIERALGAAIRPAALFDHPTVAAFAAYLEQASAAKPKQDITGEAPPTAVLNSELLQRLRAAMSVWTGERRDEFSLLVGRRTQGAGMPVFWCGQGSAEFDDFANLLPPEMPLYGTRSLFLFEGKKHEDEAALAQMLALEVTAVAAGRQIIVGGLCAGGRIAFQVACHLRERGEPIKMVFMHEVFPAQSLDVPVAVGMCASFDRSPYRQFNRPEAVMQKRCSAGFNLWTLGGDHDDVYKPHSLPQEMAKLISLWSDTTSFQPPAPMVEVPTVAYRARYSCLLYPRWWRANRQATVRVKVTNTSNHVWHPGARSGLHLGCRWLDAAGKRIGDPGASVALPGEVLPGGSIAVKLNLTVPTEPGQRLLEIDMVDEGIAWFSEKKSQHPTQALRLKVRILDFDLFRFSGQRPRSNLLS